MEQVEALKLLKPGTQIIYTPMHVNRLYHPDIEKGFVTSITKNGAFCRYWSNSHPGLRTMANSELTSFEALTIKNTHRQEEVDKLLKSFEEEQK